MSGKSVFCCFENSSSLGNKNRKIEILKFSDLKILIFMISGSILLISYPAVGSEQLRGETKTRM